MRLLTIALGASIALGGLLAIAPTDSGPRNDNRIEQAPPTCPRPPFDDPPFCYPVTTVPNVSSVTHATPATRTRQS